jgi:hypothetical protein
MSDHRDIKLWHVPARDRVKPSKSFSFEISWTSYLGMQKSNEKGNQAGNWKKI